MTTFSDERELATWVRTKLLAKKSQAALAREIGVSKAYLCDFLKGDRRAGPTLLKKLKIKKVIRFSTELKVTEPSP